MNSNCTYCSARLVCECYYYIYDYREATTGGRAACGASSCQEMYKKNGEIASRKLRLCIKGNNQPIYTFADLTFSKGWMDQW